MFVKKKKESSEEKIIIDNDIYTYEVKKEDEDFRAPKIKEEKIKPREALAKYDPNFKMSTYWKILIMSIIVSIALGFIFQLADNEILKEFADNFTHFRVMLWISSIPKVLVSLKYVIAIVIADIIMVPKMMADIYRNKYEEQKFNDATSYIEQMLYSFRRNSKILTSLIDTSSMFYDGHMKDTIQKAINYIVTTTEEEDVYKKAFEIIEREYRCRRIMSLHRYLIKVENTGGNHNMGVSALLRDRRMWIERIDEFKKEKSSVIKEILIATIFSSVVILLTMYMLPQNIGASKNTVARVVSTIYIIASLTNMKAAVHRTVMKLNDIENVRQEQYTVKKLRWFKNYSEKAERKRVIIPTIVLIGCAVISFKINKFIGLLFLALAVFAMFIQPKLKYKSTKNMIISEVEKNFPDWLMELALLLQIDNLHIALEKTLDSAPAVLKEDLQGLYDSIMSDPNALDPYVKFLNYLPLPNVHSAMKLMYSIAEFGSEEEQQQIQELIERNALLMDKAEQAKNYDRLSKVFALKFVPMLTSVLKMITDMAVFLLLFLTQALSAI